VKSSFVAGLATGAALGAVAGVMLEAKDKTKKKISGSDGFFKSVGTLLDSFMPG
jgi:hypothetical protein